MSEQVYYGERVKMLLVNHQTLLLPLCPYVGSPFVNLVFQQLVENEIKCKALLASISRGDGFDS